MHGYVTTVEDDLRDLLSGPAKAASAADIAARQLRDFSEAAKTVAVASFEARQAHAARPAFD